MKALDTDLAVNDCLMIRALGANTNKLIADAVWHTVRQVRLEPSCPFWA